eukprot:TRINITY_DN21330_c0_g4_i1.p1 TRINITY_DN21330_c0_g4~~TRINITY_DN21330_c0_g4_i1.p1  ORF type:complete len:1374 (+),score=343.14 TRINITY_DN21330_c0_g4_i1:78-4124(+)
MAAPARQASAEELPAARRPWPPPQRSDVAQTSGSPHGIAPPHRCVSLRTAASCVGCCAAAPHRGPQSPSPRSAPAAQPLLEAQRRHSGSGGSGAPRSPVGPSAAMFRSGNPLAAAAASAAPPPRSPHAAGTLRSSPANRSLQSSASLRALRDPVLGALEAQVAALRAELAATRAALAQERRAHAATSRRAAWAAAGYPSLRLLFAAAPEQGVLRLRRAAAAAAPYALRERPRSPSGAPPPAWALQWRRTSYLRDALELLYTADPRRNALLWAAVSCTRSFNHRRHRRRSTHDTLGTCSTDDICRSPSAMRKQGLGGEGRNRRLRFAPNIRCDPDVSTAAESEQREDHSSACSSPQNTGSPRVPERKGSRRSQMSPRRRRKSGSQGNGTPTSSPQSGRRKKSAPLSPGGSRRHSAVADQTPRALGDGQRRSGRTASALDHPRHRISSPRAACSPRARGGSGGDAMKDKMDWKQGSLLGQGAFGAVHLALNNTTGQLMAVKRIKFDMKDAKLKAKLQQLQTELHLLKTLDHPNIVRYLGTERDGATVLIFMEYVAGGSVADLLTQFGNLAPDTACQYTKQILDGLVYLHKRNVIHRDIKAANVLLSVQGDCKLSDFGASAMSSLQEDRGTSPTHTKLRRQSMQGTPSHMAPEVITQQVYDSAVDIWSLGCTAMEMLTGSLPFSYLELTSIELLRYIAGVGDAGDQPVELPPDELPVQCLEFLQRCLLRDPTERPTAEELCRDPWFRDLEDDSWADDTATSSDSESYDDSRACWSAGSQSLQLDRQYSPRSLDRIQKTQHFVAAMLRNTELGLRRLSWRRWSAFAKLRRQRFREALKQSDKIIQVFCLMTPNGTRALYYARLARYALKRQKQKEQEAYRDALRRRACSRQARPGGVDDLLASSSRQGSPPPTPRSPHCSPNTPTESGTPCLPPAVVAAQRAPATLTRHLLGATTPSSQAASENRRELRPATTTNSAAGTQENSPQSSVSKLRVDFALPTVEAVSDSPQRDGPDSPTGSRQGTMAASGRETYRARLISIGTMATSHSGEVSPRSETRPQGPGESPKREESSESPQCDAGYRFPALPSPVAAGYNSNLSIVSPSNTTRSGTSETHRRVRIQTPPTSPPQAAHGDPPPQSGRHLTPDTQPQFPPGRGKRAATTALRRQSEVYSAGSLASFRMPRCQTGGTLGTAPSRRASFSPSMRRMSCLPPAAAATAAANVQRGDVRSSLHMRLAEKLAADGGGSPALGISGRNSAPGTPSNPSISFSAGEDRQGWSLSGSQVGRWAEPTPVAEKQSSSATVAAAQTGQSAGSSQQLPDFSASLDGRPQSQGPSFAFPLPPAGPPTGPPASA